jgi:signal transduction histidine kinase
MTARTSLITDGSELTTAGPLHDLLVHWRRSGSLVRSVLLVTLLALLVAWAAVAGVLAMKWRDALDAEQQHTANLAAILQEQTVRVLAASDQATIRLRDAVRAGDVGAGDTVRFANETGLAPKILTQLSLVGPDGRFRGSNLDPDGSKSGHVDLSDREHVRVHLAPALVPEAPPLSAGGLLVGKPVLGKVSKKWTIQLSRRIDGADGRVLGVVVASLDASYFEDLYRSVALGDRGGVSLIGTDQVVRARVIGGQALGIGTSTKVAGRPSLLQGVRGHWQSASGVDGVERLVSYHQVGDYPLYVAVLRASDEALANWRSTRAMALALTALLTVAVLASAVIVGLGVRRLERSNAALRASEAQANASNQAKTEFLAAISHELRTPLTSIRGFSELMELRLPDPRHRDQAGMIRKAAEHLNRLLTEILDLVKVEAGAMRIDRTPVALRPVLEGTASFFAVTAAEKQLALQVQVAPGVPDTLLCDELRLKQILNNLLSNALKFTSEGGVTIAAEAVGAQLQVHVVDTGPGIDPALHATIFERFRQGDATVAYQHGGTGLGLALSRALAELMGGTLRVQSTPGQGARFTLALPLA